ncbi:hypothetical protein H5410_008951 [Solanum commersonii]|uniref:Uncharacterized protein n=1 Tax=Solanum commersonii TaxID=4109 RepID=A0A9J6AGF8_SOLCO|nr:hypothetical protein H5410_008951 [Solanum commersonii]
MHKKKPQVPVFPQPTFGEADAKTLSDVPIDSDIHASDNDGLEQIPEDAVPDVVLDEPPVDVVPDDVVLVEPRTRQSTTASNPRVWMKDFVTNVTNPDHPYSVANYIAYQHLSPQYQVFLSIWESDVRYEQYKIDGIVVGENISFVNLKSAIAAELNVDE